MQQAEEELMGATRQKMVEKCEGWTDAAGETRSIVVRRCLKVAMNTMNLVWCF